MHAQDERRAKELTAIQPQFLMGDRVLFHLVPMTCAPDRMRETLFDSNMLAFVSHGCISSVSLRVGS